VVLFGAALSVIALIILVIIGLAIIVLIIGSLLFFLPAAVVAFVVWLLTRDLFLAGVAFLIITVLMIVFRR